jgi:hypothetical protein
LSKKTPKGDTRLTEEERRETNHMDTFRRLARVVNMHGKPGEKKKKTH